MYAMERDSRRDRGQWRGCHTFQNIICDGNHTPARQVPRSGGLKMGQTYYYYYEVDGSLETHDPSIESTTTCPYLPGQRVNTLWVPIEQPPSSSYRQRSASINALRRCDFQTMEPADRFLTPRPPPATPSTMPSSTASVPATAAPAMAAAADHRPLATSKHLLRHQRSARSLSPAASSLSTWSPRRLFARRASPSRETTRTMVTPDELSEEDDFAPSSLDSRPAPPLRLASSSSGSSFSSISRLRNATLAPTPAPSQGSRSRDISPESLRRFLVDDVPLDGPCDNVSFSGSVTVPFAAVDTSAANSQNSSFFLAESDDEDDDDNFASDSKSNTNTDADMDLLDDDEHNFATSTTSETAPLTVLSPPPPPSRTITPPKVEEVLVQPQEDITPITSVVEEIVSALPLPEAPTRAPPAIPVAASEPVEALAPEAEPSPEIVDKPSTSALDLPQLSLTLELPSIMAPPSPMSLSPLSLSSLAGDWKASESRALSTTDTDEDEEDNTPTAAPREPVAFFLPSSEHLFQGSESSKAESQQNHRHHRHHLVDAALTGSTATLVPGNGLISAGNGSGLDDLVDELGWMATAIQG
ncbi:hypothetical protein SEUCBS139899_000099 [Sporothrix eucalyptigena]